MQLGADGGTPEALAAILILADQGIHALAVLQVGEGEGTEGQQLLQRRSVLRSGALHEVTGHLCHEMRPVWTVGLHRLLQLAQQPCSLCFDFVGGEGLAQPLLVPRLCEKQVRQAGM